MTKEMVKKESAEIANVFGDVAASEFSGMVRVSSSLIKVPRLKVAQAMSGATDGGLTKVGEFNIELMGLNFGPSVKIIPISISETASLIPKDSKVPICSTKNLLTNQSGESCSACPHDANFNKWEDGPNGKRIPPKCKKSIDIICVVYGQSQPCVLSMAKSNYAAGRVIVNKAFYDPLKVSFGSMYTLQSERSQNDAKQVFYTIDANSIKQEPIDPAIAKDILRIAREVKAAQDRGEIAVDTDHDDDLPI